MGEDEVEREGDGNGQVSIKSDGIEEEDETEEEGK